jgi:hypothetical protein
MKMYRENDSVVYTDETGRKIDTFVIFDTDHLTGITHINHNNLQVSANELELHPRSANGCSMPMDDSISFELFKQLKEKYLKRDEMAHARGQMNADARVINILAKAS